MASRKRAQPKTYKAPPIMSVGPNTLVRSFATIRAEFLPLYKMDNVIRTSSVFCRRYGKSHTFHIEGDPQHVQSLVDWVRQQNKEGREACYEQSGGKRKDRCYNCLYLSVCSDRRSAS